MTARFKPVRAGLGPILSGLQSLPSVAWVPPALMFFGPTPAMLYTVVLLGAVPSISVGVMSGLDQVPPLYLRVGHNIGARGLASVRHVLLPAALPGYIAGLRQGWAFAWRSLLAYRRQGLQREARARRRHHDEARRRRPRRRGALGQASHRRADQVHRHRRASRRARRVPSRPHGRPHPGPGRHAVARRKGAAEIRPGRNAARRKSGSARASSRSTTSASSSPRSASSARCKKSWA